MMPYNTRRKSLSLPSLGIHVPVTHAERAAANRASQSGGKSSSGSSSGSHYGHAYRRPSPSSSTPTSTPSSAAASPSASSSTFLDSLRQPPSKKMKRSYDGESQSPRHTSIPKKQKPQPQHRPMPPPPLPSHHIHRDAFNIDNTPPPSPKPERADSVEMPDSDMPATIKIRSINLGAINDEIVVAVIVQLQNTGNRPHLVKELATILMLQLRIVQQSANPCAIISSRLSTFLKRPGWSALAPCPLAKELETVHPRRTYFYLTTCPHQPLPDSSSSSSSTSSASISISPMVPLLQRAIITPSLSSATSASEDADEERRRELSPSPEVDLTAPEFDDLDDDLPMPTTPIGSFSGCAGGLARLPPLTGPHHHHAGGRNHRGTSPPLEKDEKEFTQTANVLQQKRKASGHLLLSGGPLLPSQQMMMMEVLYNSRDENLFGGQQVGSRPFASASASASAATTAVHTSTTPTAPQAAAFAVTSPAIRPSFDLGLKRDGEADSWAKLDGMLEWDRSPENIELDELDGLLVGF